MSEGGGKGNAQRPNEKGWLLYAVIAEDSDAARTCAKRVSADVFALIDWKTGSVSGCPRMWYTIGRGPLHCSNRCRVSVYLHPQA